MIMFYESLFTSVVSGQNKPEVYIKVRPEPDPKSQARFAALS